jgi:AsmA protein
MKSRVIRIIKKTLQITGITIGSLLLLLFLLPYILPNTISRKIKTLVNKSIDGEVNFTKARLSFFNHFPALTLTLEDFTLRNGAPFMGDTLVNAGDVSFGIDIPALIGGNIKVDKFFLSDANIHVRVRENGDANYNVYKSSGNHSDTSSSGGDTTASLKIEKIIIEKSHIIYDDTSSGVFINAKNVNYSGNGDLSKAIFDLQSHVAIDSFDFYLDREPYILKKKINADLVTQVNTNSLAFIFEKNKLQINKLPLEFTGKFNFLSRGYDIDFRFKSDDARLRSIFTVLPPSYNGWLKKTKMKGNADLTASLIGRYIGGTDTMPDIKFNLHVRDGSITYEDAPAAVSNLYLDLDTRLPSLNMDSLVVNVDSVFFNVDKDYFSSVFRMKGFNAPFIFTKTNSEIDLEKLDRALGLENFELKGKLNLQLSADGQYRTGQNPDRFRKDIIVRSIPSFHLRSSLQNGFVHYTPLPQSVQKLSFKLVADCPDHDYHHSSVSMEDIDIRALNNYIKGFIRLKNAEDFPVDANLDVLMKLSDIQQFYPLDSMNLNGNLTVKLTSSGNYQPAKKVFPKTEALLKVENASLKTKYYPTPIEKINVEAVIQNKAGTFYDMAVDVKPIAFEFEGKPFMMKADLHNLDNIQYAIESKGEVDLGQIYKVFSRKGWGVQGTIQTNLLLKGNQADATAGRYNKLNNSGTLKVNQLTLYSDLYPKPFYIDKGVFLFHQDQMKFEEFRAKYGNSTFTLNGDVSNVFNYTAGSGPLRGSLNLSSNHVFLDELMAYKSDSTSARPDSLSVGSSGVIMVPGDLDLKLMAAIKNADYNKLHIKDIKGELQISNGELKLNQTGFTLADAVTVMDATYKSLSPARAYFTYHIAANDFDVKKVYNEVELFRQLAPAAAKAQGIISLDYNLEGKLNGDMYPIMPSLKGGGVLSVKKVKMKGFSFFSAMGRETGKDGIKDSDLSKINFKTSIKNNVITLEKTKIKVAGFRLRIQGQTSFDGAIKFRCRLGLPPFGIIGIPMNITGTGENPKIKLGKGDELPLEEQQEELNDKDNL